MGTRDVQDVRGVGRRREMGVEPQGHDFSWPGKKGQGRRVGVEK